MFARDGKFRGWRRRESDINYVISHSHERTANDLLYHVSTQARIASHYDLVISR